MQPRLSSSHKWTTLPADFTAKVLQVFNENFKAAAQTGEFIVEGRIYTEEILVRIGYLEKGRLRQVNFEASKEYSQLKGDSFAMIYLCVDAIGAAMEQYFDSTDEVKSIEDFPMQWDEVELEDGVVYLQVSTVNSRLEAEADRLLKAAEEKALVYEEQQSEDALARALIDTDLAFDIQAKIRKGDHLN